MSNSTFEQVRRWEPKEFSFDFTGWNPLEITTKVRPTIKQVIFNDPATIILWTDGTKTVVKCCDGDEYDAETGFYAAYLKKLLGTKQFNKDRHKWVKEENKPLTIEELRRMDGQRVWLSSIDEGQENFTDRYTGWYTVRANREQLIGDFYNRYPFEDNGKWYGFKAYRKPPKQSGIVEKTPKEEKPYKTKPPFNVGDKVKIVDHRNWHWNDDGNMDHWMGKIMTIRTCESGTYHMTEDQSEHCGCGWYWDSDDFVQE